MEEALQGGGKVLVNCWQGASRLVVQSNSSSILIYLPTRSTTMVLAYLVKYKKMDLAEALRVVKEKRDVRPNNGFLKQLIYFQTKCRND